MCAEWRKQKPRKGFSQAKKLQGYHKEYDFLEGLANAPSWILFGHRLSEGAVDSLRAVRKPFS